MRFISLCVLPLAVCLLASVVLAFDAHTPFDISADMIEYIDADQVMTADGHVVVVQGTSTLKADHMRYERQAQHIYARGHVDVNDKGAIMLGESLVYDLEHESGTVTSALGYQSPWIFSGAEWHKELDYFVGHQVSFTSCDLADPHYHLRSSSVHLVPNQQFWAWNNVAYADTVPVFYSPFMYKNLAKRRVVIQFQPGHDDVNGDFLKTLTTLRFTDLIYDKVLYDHYSQAGNGFGNELNYQVPGKIQGSVFAYYIDPHSNPDLSGAPNSPQYNFRSYHWQRLDDAHTLQSNVNLRKNISFNNQYFSQDTNQSVSDITSSIALTRQKDKTNQRLVVEQTAAPDPGDTSPFAETHVQTASLPRYDFTLYQIPLWNKGETKVVGKAPDSSVLAASSASVTQSSTSFRVAPMKSDSRWSPLMLSANANMGDTYQRADKLMHANADGSFSLTEAIPVSRDWSLTAAVTPRISWQDKFDAQPPPPVGSTVPIPTAGLFRGYQGRVGTNETLRWRPLSALTIDNTYSLNDRLEPNGTSLDRDSADGGVETHHLNWLAFWRPSRKILFRSFSGYDLRNLADEPPDIYEQRKWDPWTTELTLEATAKTDYFFRYQTGHYPERTLQWQVDYRYRGAYNSQLDTGMLYNKGAPGTVTWNNTIGLFLSPGWRADVTLHTILPTTNVHSFVTGGNMIDDEFIITRDMHCWEAKFIYRNIAPFTRSYSILFNLKLGVKAKEEITNKALETTYYPWRAREYAQ